MARLCAVVLAILLLVACGGGQQGAANVEGGQAGKLPPAPTPSATPPWLTAADQQEFVTAVFDDIQVMWTDLFRKAGERYAPARLSTFTSAVSTACGTQKSEVGPFYCPADGTVYIDLRFLTQMQQQLGAPGDFAQAYVVAHEMGHHVQNVLGISSRVAQADHANPAGANARSVRVELQADCLAGIWVHSAYSRDLVTPGEFKDALNAAAAVGDDFQQKLTTGQVEPDRWTHGSSAQRQRWLTTGYEKGEVSACDTFSGAI